MGDMNARRDARQRRILENSEKRLLKITGRDSKIETQATTSDVSQLFNEIGKILSSTDDKIWNRTSTSESISNDRKNETEENIHNIHVRTNRLQIPLLTNRINYIALAVIVNILLLLELDHYFGKTIAIPCLPILFGRIYSSKNKLETQGDNLLYAALHLCNVNPKYTYQFKRFIALTSTIFGDLALYIFSFTSVYYVLFYYCFCKTDIVTVLNT